MRTSRMLLLLLLNEEGCGGVKRIEMLLQCGNCSKEIVQSEVQEEIIVKKTFR